MNRYDEHYSVYFGAPSEEYPEGSAVDSTDEDKLDGTPFLSKFFNDVIGFMYAAFHGVYGNPKIPGQTVTRQLSNEPENATRSDVWDAIKKFVADSVQTVRDALNAFMSTKGQANGIAPLDSSGKVSASYLPSYVDDVLEYNDRASFPASGEDGKIYVAKDTNKSYRWSGSTYVELSKYDNATQSASGLMSAADKTKLDGIAEGATNTPAPVNADWNAESGLAQIKNKPTIPAAPVNADWNAESGLAEIKNKPTIPAAQVNSDWDASSGVAQILNRPTIPTKTSQLENDSGFLTSHQSLAGYATENWVSSHFPIVIVCKSFEELLAAIPEGGVRNVMGIRIAGAFPSLSRPSSTNILNFLVGSTPTAIGVWTISRSGGSATNYTFEQAFGGGPAYVF